MQGIPIVKSKITMPQLPGSVVISERIKKLAKEIYHKHAVIITAPSGYGKTTLMMAALDPCRESKCRTSWYRLEPEDRDLAVFYAYLIEALFPGEDEIWRETRATLEKIADYQSQYRYINALICQELWSFCNKHHNIKTFIVFDDFQNVKDTPEIAESIAYFINNLPANCVVLVSSRQAADILTEKQKLEKNIMEIRQADLCFVENEISELLKKTYKINTGKKLLQKIMTNTEGWIAGVIMVCQVMSEVGITETGSLLEKPWPKTKLFSYIAAEVLKTVDAGMLQFLVKAAILQDFTVQEIEEILGIKNAAQLLGQCEKKGLFIQKIIRDNITYRFHSLFRDTLLELQHEYYGNEEIKDLNLNAAAYYIEHKLFDRAIEHFIACGDLNSAVQLITKESTALITFQAVEQLRLWFNLLPEDVVEENPTLLYLKSFTYHQGKNPQTIILMEKALQKYREQNNINMQLLSLGMLTNYYIIANKINRALELISQALAILKPVKNSGDNYKLVWRVFLFLRFICEEKLSRAFIFAKHLKDREMPEDWKWVVLAYSCSVGYHIGELNFAENVIKDLFNLNLVKRAELFRGYALTLYARMLYLKNDPAAFAALENEQRTIGEKYDFNFMLGFGKIASAYLKYARHDLDNAVDLLDASIYHFEQYGNTIIASVNKLCCLLWLSRRKSPQELLPEAENTLRVLVTQRPGFCLQEIGRSMFGAIARECGEYVLAEKNLLASAESSAKKGAKQILCGLYLHLARLYFDTGEKAKAVDYLHKAFALAAKNGYTMFWDIHLPTLTEMAVRGLKTGIYAEYAGQLLEKYYKPEAVLYIKRNLHLPDDGAIRDFTEKILLRYGAAGSTDFSYTIDIRLFGRFEIAVNGAAIADDEWKTKKIKGILEYLVLHKGRVVTRDQLMELFWPEADKKSAAMSLRAALYELKKVLAKYGVKNEGSAQFIHERAGSLEIRPNNMLFIDIDEFLQLYHEYKNRCKNKSGKKQVQALLERMNALYTGDLLDDEVYWDWTFVDREELKSVYLETVMALASLYIAEKESKMAEKLLLKVLSVDQYNEEACLMLLNLYVSANQRSRAVKLYNSFARRLENDLNVKPNESLQSVVKF